MKYNRAERDTSRIFAIEALDTFLPNNIRISACVSRITKSSEMVDLVIRDTQALEEKLN